MLLDLNLTRFQDQLKIKTTADKKRHIFDPIRQKWLVLQPEEFVRQLLILYLIEEKAYKKNRFSIEKGIYAIKKKYRRYDMLVLDEDMNPFLLVECKAPNISLDVDNFWQLGTYNYQTQIPYLLLSNGHSSYCCALKHTEKSLRYLNDVPTYGEKP